MGLVFIWTPINILKLLFKFQKILNQGSVRFAFAKDGDRLEAGKCVGFRCVKYVAH